MDAEEPPPEIEPARPPTGYRESPPRIALSASKWHRFRRTLTAGLFAVATLAGVDVGLQGAPVSPVSSNPAVVVPAAVHAPHTAHGHRHHR